jgi:putative transposase
MPRIARLVQANGYYHIVSRSLNETRIFRDDDDFSFFLNLAYKAKQKYPMTIFHYVIMNTHFHFVVQCRHHPSLSQNIAHMKWHYTSWIRKKYGWRGPLWRERFKSLAIENEDYLHMCGLYIVYNPVRAKICNHPSEYPYSSYKKYFLGSADRLIDGALSRPFNSKQFDYASNVTKRFFSQSIAIGSDPFIKQFSES